MDDNKIRIPVEIVADPNDDESPTVSAGGADTGK